MLRWMLLPGVTSSDVRAVVVVLLAVHICCCPLLPSFHVSYVAVSDCCRKHLQLLLDE